MERNTILKDIEELQDEAYEQGFMGSNERELFFRESIADYILSKLHQPTVSDSVCIHDWKSFTNDLEICINCDNVRDKQTER